MPNFSAIQSEGDLEVVFLHQTHDFLSQVIGPDLYSIHGTVPDQQVIFCNEPCFNLFLIYLVEFFAEGTRSALINEKFQNWSLLDSLSWFCKTHPEESMNAGLQDSISELERWAARGVEFEFWAPDVNTQIQFNLSNEQLISFGANTVKHHIFRLSGLFHKLEALCRNAGYEFAAQEYPAILNTMNNEVRSRLTYHSTYLIEMLGKIFHGLNAVIRQRFNENPTNRVAEMRFPEGLTSDVFKDLYGDVIVFKRYDDARILNHTPTTSPILKLRYQE